MFSYFRNPKMIQYITTFSKKNNYFCFLYLSMFIIIGLLEDRQCRSKDWKFEIREAQPNTSITGEATTRVDSGTIDASIPHESLLLALLTGLCTSHCRSKHNVIIVSDFD